MEDCLLKQVLNAAWDTTAQEMRIKCGEELSDLSSENAIAQHHFLEPGKRVRGYIEIFGKLGDHSRTYLLCS
jgi:hypothetical protein